MRTSLLRRRLVAAVMAALVPAALLVGGSNLSAAAAAVTAPPDALDGTCATLQVFSGSSSLGYVARNGGGYGFTSGQDRATPFRLEATGLSHYMLYDAAGAPAYMSVINWVMPGTVYGDRADWTFDASGSRYTITSTATGQRLGAYFWGVGAANGASTVALSNASGCFDPPEVETGVSSKPTPGVDANGKIIGAIDAHMHVTAAAGFGGQLHCGEAWSPGGVVTALSGCSTHRSLNVGAVLEGVLGGTDIVNSPEDGWPTFGDWPQVKTELHEQSYYRSIERAYRSGVRIIDALLVTNRVICELFPYRDGSCDEMASVRVQAKYLRSMQDYIDAQNGGAGKGWFRIATTPEQVRSIARQGKMAVVVGMEISEPFGCREIRDVPQCTTADIDAGLDEVRRLGVSGIFPIHKFDNAFGGTRMDPGVSGAAVNVGNLLSTGHWWELRSCTGPADLEQPITSDDFSRLLSFGVLGLPAGSVLPVYPTGPTCNVRGLTQLGEYLVRRMMERGMVIHIDHMSVLAAQRTMDILDEANYPGVTTDHTWSDPAIVDRVVGAGGFVAGYAFASGEAVIGQPTFVGEWRKTRAMPHGHEITGYGFGSDVNGLAAQPPPRASSATRPLKYPFTAINGTTVWKQTMGKRTFDLNTDGVAQYGLYADWLADVVLEAGEDGPELHRELMNGAEAYTAMWERAIAW